VESHWRSIIKAVTWRAGGTFVTFVTAWFFVGTVETAVKIGFFDTCVKIAAFYIHERFWNRLKFGQLRQPEYHIQFRRNRC
jgi:bifunctional enzyme CysN/CysC/sulfate adenylyltransferase subunit 1